MSLPSQVLCKELYEEHPNGFGIRIRNDTGNIRFSDFASEGTIPSCFWGECNVENNTCICFPGAAHDRLILRQNDCGIADVEIFKVVALASSVALLLVALSAVFNFFRVQKKSHHHRRILIHCAIASMLWAGLALYYYFFLEMGYIAIVLFVLGSTNTVLMVGHIIISVLKPVEFFLPKVSLNKWKILALQVIPFLYFLFPSIAFSVAATSGNDESWNISLVVLGLVFAITFIIVLPKVFQFVDELLRGLQSVSKRRPTILVRDSISDTKSKAQVEEAHISSKRISAPRDEFLETVGIEEVKQINSPSKHKLMVVGRIRLQDEEVYPTNASSKQDKNSIECNSQSHEAFPPRKRCSSCHSAMCGLFCVTLDEPLMDYSRRGSDASTGSRNSRVMQSSNKNALRLKRKVLVLRRFSVFAASALCITCIIIALLQFSVNQVPFMFVTVLSAAFGFALGGIASIYYARVGVLPRPKSSASLNSRSSGRF